MDARRSFLSTRSSQVQEPAKEKEHILVEHQTFTISPVKGTLLKGIELKNSYVGPVDAEGRRHGKGSYTYPNHIKYEGEYMHGKKHGIGKLTFPNNDFYRGQFKDDEINGKGASSRNGNSYRGLFSMGEYCGSGVLTLKNGDVYEGEFERNCMHGHGQMTFANHCSYEGSFVNNKRTGEGKMHYASGDEYQGSWLDGKRHGQGRCTYSNGDVYEGSWADDEPCGEGRLQVVMGGLVYQGRFQGGKPSQVPTKINILVPASVVGSSSGKKAPAAGKGGAPEDLPPLSFPPGAPSPFPLVVAAQSAVPLTDAELAALNPPPPVKGAPPPPPPPVQPYAYPEPPPDKHAWSTASMESQRATTISLHASPPVPLPPDRLVGLCIVSLLERASGKVGIRALISPAQLGPPIPMFRTEEGQVVNGLALVLEGGEAVVEGMVMGGGEGMGSANGFGCLVATGWPMITPGFVKVQIPVINSGKGK